MPSHDTYCKWRKFFSLVAHHCKISVFIGTGASSRYFCASDCCVSAQGAGSFCKCETLHEGLKRCPTKHYAADVKALWLVQAPLSLVQAQPGVDAQSESHSGPQTIRVYPNACPSAGLGEVAGGGGVRPGSVQRTGFRTTCYRLSTTRGGPHRAGQSRMCEGVALGKDGQGVPNPNSRPSFSRSRRPAFTSIAD